MIENKKVKTPIELYKILELLKKKGKKIVFCNGCFDLIHVGHIRYLKSAKSLGDILVLALNSDESVRKLKGKGRPVLPLEERIEILSEFPFIDYITYFDENNVSSLLKLLKPDIHAKGTDYTVENVPERDTVIAYGGKVAIAGDTKNHSTRDIIKKLKEES